MISFSQMFSLIALMTSVAAVDRSYIKGLDLLLLSELHKAAKDGDAELCGALLEKGADVNAQNYDKETPLMNAIDGGNNKCAKMILAKDPELEIQSQYYGTALHYAARNGNEEMCGALLEKGADVNAQGAELFLEKYTPLMCAIDGGKNKCAKMILAKNPELELQSKCVGTALHIAARKVNELMCGALLEKGADVNAQDDDGDTPLMRAIGSRNNKCAKKILRKYPKLEIQNRGGETAFARAIILKNDEMVKILGFAEPLMISISFQNNNCEKLILRSKYPKFEIQNWSREPALARAISSWNDEMVKILEIALKEGIKKAVGECAWEERKNFLQIYNKAKKSFQQIKM